MMEDISRSESAPSAAPNARRATGPVLPRALRLLDAFQPARTVLTLSQLAAHAGLPLSTAHRMVADLCAWGALDRDGEGRYSIGLRVRQLAALAPRGNLLREMCLPTMEELVERTACSCVLAVLDGTDVVNVEVLAGTRSALRVTGQRSHALLTAAGRVLIAFADAHIRRDALERPVPRATPETVTAPGTLREILAGIRRAGVCVSRQQADIGFDGVAAAVRDGAGTVPAVLSLVVPTGAVDLPSLTTATAAAGRAVSRVLQPLRPAPARDGAPGVPARDVSR